MTSVMAQGIRWNLSELYQSLSDPAIEQDLKQTLEKARAFEKNYKPFFDSPSACEKLPLGRLLEDYKILATALTKLGVFAHLSFASDTAKPETGAFLQKIQVALTDIQAHLVFFEVRWSGLDGALAQKLMAAPEAARDRHFLEKLRIYAPHTLAEGEEKVMSSKANSGVRAFGRLFDEVINNIPFEIEIDGRKVRKSEAEVLSLFHSPRREERLKASESLTQGLAKESRLLTFIYNMILQDHRIDLKLRRYEHPMDPMNLSNEIERASVMNLIESVKASYPVAMRYYRLKRRLLGLDKLYDYDRYATLPGDETKVSFEECRRIVLDGYYALSPEAGEIVEMFFERGWIDAEVREGKRGGAFSCQTTPDLHPYILANYTDTLRDVMTIAHELGHGLHQYLAGKKVGILESDAPLTMAETASVFGEMLIFEKILSAETDPKKRLGLLCGKIDDNFATVFRQIAMTDFELRAHTAGIERGELSSEVLSDFWMAANAEFYGDSVELTANYRHGWKYIPHFVHSPFYCYAYSFAQLFVLTLFQKYKEERESFVPKYLEMLSWGGSKKPEQLAAIAGLDIREPGFWQKGLRLLENLVSEAENLAARL